MHFYLCLNQIEGKQQFAVSMHDLCVYIRINTMTRVPMSSLQKYM